MYGESGCGKTSIINQIDDIDGIVVRKHTDGLRRLVTSRNHPSIEKLILGCKDDVSKIPKVLNDFLMLQHSLFMEYWSVALREYYSDTGGILICDRSPYDFYAYSMCSIDLARELSFSLGKEAYNVFTKATEVGSDVFYNSSHYFNCLGNYVSGKHMNTPSAVFSILPLGLDTDNSTDPESRTVALNENFKRAWYQYGSDLNKEYCDKGLIIVNAMPLVDRVAFVKREISQLLNGV